MKKRERGRGINLVGAGDGQRKRGFWISTSRLGPAGRMRGGSVYLEERRMLGFVQVDRGIDEMGW